MKRKRDITLTASFPGMESSPWLYGVCRPLLQRIISSVLLPICDGPCASHIAAVMPDPGIILLVEDDANDAALAERALREVGVPNQIIHLQDGEEAINYLSGEPPYEDRMKFPLPLLILLDLKMPKYSGFEVLEWLRAHSELSHVPVVILTGSIYPADRQRATQLGAIGYEVKPVDSTELVSMATNLRRHLPQTTRPPD